MTSGEELHHEYSSEKSKFQHFCENLAILQRDQPIFAGMLGSSELPSNQHEDIVHLGEKMLKNLLKIAKKGEHFTDNNPDFLDNMISIILEYHQLIKPRKRICKCLKTRRIGIEYEKKLLIIKAKMTLAVYLPIGIMIEERAEITNNESIRFGEYVNRMNIIFKQLDSVKLKGSEITRDNARKDLLNFLKTVENFIEFYFDAESDSEFRSNVRARLRKINSLLSDVQMKEVVNEGNTSPSKQNPKIGIISRRTLVSAQAGLQEIMNSTASIANSKAKDNITVINRLEDVLQQAYTSQSNSFIVMEDSLNKLGVYAEVSILRQDCETVQNDCKSKIKDAKKHWMEVKEKAKLRPVAVFEEPQQQQGAAVPVVQDATKIADKATKKLKQVGKGGANVAKEVTSEISSAVGMVRDDIFSFVDSRLQDVKDAAKSTTSTLKNIPNKTKDLFDINNSSDDISTSGERPQGKKTDNLLKLPSMQSINNILDKI